MAKLEQITEGCNITGILGAEAVTVVAVKRYGTNSVEIVFKDSRGVVSTQLLYRSNEDSIAILDSSLPWGFTADANRFRLVSEAYRISLAHIFDPYLAVHTSDIDPLPHQISAVYQEMLPRLPLRYILADDPGAGKTIMTGLLLKELIVRGDLKRCLIVTPGNLAEQWKDELYGKFKLTFDILSNDSIESAVTGNVFLEKDFMIARLDKLSRNDALQDRLRVTDWDLIVCDEAHKMSATIWGNEPQYTKRYRLGELLSSVTRHFLLLTATPHNGKEEDFQLFMKLIDQDRFEGAVRNKEQKTDVSDVMRRLVKEDMLTFDNTPLFPKRIAFTLPYSLSAPEKTLYEAVTEYVQEEFNRADKLTNDRKTTVGFALTILQRRLASSPEAIYQSLRRRRERLEKRLEDTRLGRREAEYRFGDYEEYDEDDMTASELEEAEEKVVDQATTAQTISELEKEIKILKRLEQMANEVRMSRKDRKWDELSQLLQDKNAMVNSDGAYEKLIIFTEHRDTLVYLANKVVSLLGNENAVVTIHGGLSRDDRRKTETEFKQNKNARILIATDAAGEGINLQRAHLMVNYDLPWNPNRLEQRFGRIHRIGQNKTCHLWNLISNETREGRVFERLLEKLNKESEALKGKVFDILGQVTFADRSLRELLIEAIRSDDDPERQEWFYKVVDNSLDHDALQKLIEEHVLAENVMDIPKVMEIREQMERMEALKLQPYFIEAFFAEAFTELGGRIVRREKERYEITRVPTCVRNRDTARGFGKYIAQQYERVCFDKPYCNIQNSTVSAELITPGHPLLEAVIDLVRERSADVLKRGVVFVDDADFGEDARILFCIEDTIQDGVVMPNGGRRNISKHIHFVEIKEDKSAANAGYAPYLDYRAAEAEESVVIRDWLNKQRWLKANVEDIAVDYAVSELIPRHLEEVKARKLKLIEKTAKAVKDRLTAEIRHWDLQSWKLKDQEAAGKINAKLNSDNARKNADEMEARMTKRLDELEQEKHIFPTPPVIIGGALVIPRGLLNKLTGVSDAFAADDEARSRVELAAMNAVMDIDISLGYNPKDVSANKVGYDIESLIPRENRGNSAPLRFIEVKGRVKGASSITVTKNEILTALNKPDEYILAIVEVDGENTKTVYLKNVPFRPLSFVENSTNCDIVSLVSGSEIILQRG